MKTHTLLVVGLLALSALGAMAERPDTCDDILTKRDCARYGRKLNCLYIDDECTGVEDISCDDLDSKRFCASKFGKQLGCTWYNDSCEDMDDLDCDDFIDKKTCSGKLGRRMGCVFHTELCMEGDNLTCEMLTERACDSKVGKKTGCEFDDETSECVPACKSYDNEDTCLAQDERCQWKADKKKKIKDIFKIRGSGDGDGSGEEDDQASSGRCCNAASDKSGKKSGGKKKGGGKKDHDHDHPEKAEG